MSHDTSDGVGSTGAKRPNHPPMKAGIKAGIE